VRSADRQTIQLWLDGLEEVVSQREDSTEAMRHKEHVVQLLNSSYLTTRCEDADPSYPKSEPGKRRTALAVWASAIAAERLAAEPRYRIVDGSF
jgi:hypothetical protein